MCCGGRGAGRWAVENPTDGLQSLVFAACLTEMALASSLVHFECVSNLSALPHRLRSPVAGCRNAFHENFGEVEARQTIDTLVSSGLVEAGYDYFNLDGDILLILLVTASAR